MRTKYTKALMLPIIAKAYCWNDVCRAMGKSTNGSSVKEHFRRIADFHGLDYSHFLGRGTASRYRATPEQALQLDSGFDRATIRKIIFDYSLLPYVCKICGMSPAWQGKPLTLTLDHINGNPKDHRLENLRFVCPNCDTQLPTYSGKNNKGFKTKRVRYKRKVRVNSPNYKPGVNDTYA